MDVERNKEGLSDREIFELIRESFLDSSRLDEDTINASLQFNKELHTISVNELFRQFTI